MSVWCVYKGKMSWWRDLNSWPLPYQGSALPLSYISIHEKSGRRGSNSRHSAWKAVALPTELLPQKNKNMTVGRTGFEPVKVKPADLQSALVGRLSISPRNFKLLKYVLILSRQRDSNPRPRDYKSRALANWAMPAFLSYRAQKYNKFWNLQNFWEFFLWFLIKYFLKCWKSNRF